ncbi:FtsP/CotA-like multicopper oxidase with cupredoxin domain [Silvibacterium bohemicum]|uniref:FtsP/CotA-like multicopper oxidase with cupredoxin domain n=1 Tax=Silvibacterium bohemicum TaxID=1577686 RepID=A0A841JVD6_9BACT|nr:multicopper oxidase domain-containing protein [Silvibacterium bohemicum]MBB6144427.1 FtsP/CotA-like multicopper oxidase with cupredoxin domain [Silvibacterium bohemicum]
MNMSNLHFHGLHVSPDSPQDDVISMMANPGTTLHYAVTVPLDQPPGLYWYHTHPHGESYQQSLDGMSGAIVVDGIQRYAPEVRHLRQRILILRDRVAGEHDPNAPAIRKAVGASSAGCGAASGVPQRVFTVNGSLRPRIPIASGGRQFWRIVNASPDLYADLEVDGERLEIIARDGMPLTFHDPHRQTELVDHVLVPPAGRVEAIVAGPVGGAKVSLRSRCFDTGPDGDPNPAMVIADLVSLPSRPTVSSERVGRLAPVYKPIPHATLSDVESRAPDYTVKFTEDKHGFYINGKKYGPEDPPMTTATVGSFFHWRVVNDTREVHPFHIHQVHFLVYAQNGKPEAQPEWLDTVNVPGGNSIDLVMDFTDPIIRGVSLFHCHLLSHEDKGMMAKILFK